MLSLNALIAFDSNRLWLVQPILTPRLAGPMKYSPFQARVHKFYRFKLAGYPVSLLMYHTKSI